MIALLLTWACVETAATEQEAPEPTVLHVETETPPTTDELIGDLENAETASAAIDELVRREATTALKEVALDAEDLSARGWAIHGLVELGSGEQTLEQVQDDQDNPELVRIWAAAGRIALADAEELDQLRPLAWRWPELERPIELREAALRGS